MKTHAQAMAILQGSGKGSKGRRAKLPPPSPSMLPHRCALLAVDSGRAGGWAIYLCGKLVDFGQVEGYQLEQLQAVVSALLVLAEVAGLPVAMAMERPAEGRAGGKRSFGTILGMGGTRGVWRAAWVSAGCNERRIVDAPIATWRSRVLGRGVTRLTREVVRPLEQQAARQWVLAELGTERAKLVGPDSAPAILIGRWASHASAIGKRLPVTARAA